MLSPDRIPDSTPLKAAADDYAIVRRAIAHIRGHWREQPEIEAIAEAAGVHRNRVASPVPALGRADAEGLSAGAHARLGAPSVARFRKRARRHLRGRIVRPRTAARSVRHPRSDVARRMEIRRRRPHPALWLPSLPIRHSGGNGNAARARGPRACRPRRGAHCPCRHAKPLAESDLRGRPRAYRAARAARIRPAPVAAGSATARGADRHGFRGARLGNAVAHPDGPLQHLFRYRRQGMLTESCARGRRRGRKKSRLLCRALSPRDRQEWRSHRLSLGHHPQAAMLGWEAGQAAA